MSEKSGVEFIEEWQTGAFVLLGCAFLGIVIGVVVGMVTGPIGFFPGFIGGGLLAFLAYAYLRYGR